MWSDVYSGTAELWEEGNIVLIEGKVGMRDDSIQLSCKKVSRYQPDKPKPEKPPVAGCKTFCCYQRETNSNGSVIKNPKKNRYQRNGIN